MEAPTLREYPGETTGYLNAFFDRREGGIEVIGAHKWVMPCNWKFPAENFGGDLYHVQWSHLSAIETAFSSGGVDQTGNFRKHGVTDPPVPEILDYEQQIRPDVERRLGPRRRLVNPFVGTMFPNFLDAARHLAHIRRLASART